MKIKYLLVTLLLFVASCHSVDLAKLDLAHQQVSSCAEIYVQDERPYVLSKDKSADFVGIVRGGYGNPFDFSTSSGKPMATELGLAMERALASSSGAVRFVSSGNGVSKRCKRITLKLKEWKIDAMIDAWFNVDASMSVHSASGSLLAREQITRRDAVDGSFINPLGAARSNFLKESKNTINQFLRNDKIQAALLR